MAVRSWTHVWAFSHIEMIVERSCVACISSSQLEWLMASIEMVAFKFSLGCLRNSHSCWHCLCVFVGTLAKEQS